MHLIHFKPEEIEKIWPLVKGHVQKALERNHEGRTLMNQEHVKELCVKGLKQLWVISDDQENVKGVCISEIVKYPNYNVGIVNIATGNDLPLWVDKIKDFEQWAFHNCGCKKIEVYGRPGWKKMLEPLGFHFNHVQMDKFIGGVH
jgi:hypothetical protein